MSIIAVLQYYLIHELIPDTEALKEGLEKLSGRVRTHRKRSLTAKKAGLGINVVGTVITITSFFLSAIVFPVGAVGVIIGGVGGIITISTRIADGIIDKKHFHQLAQEQKKFLQRRSKWFELLNKDPGLVEFLKNIETPYYYHIQQEHATHWIQLKLYTDVIISRDDIIPGDHIYRNVSKGKGLFSKIFSHHGVCIGTDEAGNRLVADFDKDGATIRPLEEFLQGAETITRRTYEGYDLPVGKTVDLAISIVEAGSWPEYNLTSNNCEHFATHLKLNNEIPWSSQTAKGKKLAAKVVRHAPSVSRAGQAALDIVTIALPVTKAAGKMTATALSAVTKASIIVSPIASIIDAGMLAWDVNKKNPNQEMVDFAIKTCEEQMEMFEWYLRGIQSYQRYQIARRVGFAILAVVFALLVRSIWMKSVCLLIH